VKWIKMVFLGLTMVIVIFISLVLLVPVVVIIFVNMIISWVYYQLNVFAKSTYEALRETIERKS
jgi:hypothetical protein